MEPALKLKKHGACGTLILNRPQRRNALDRALIGQLRQAIDDFHQEKSVRALLITGAGDAFCSGVDLAEVSQTFADDEQLARWHEDAVLYRGLLNDMLRFPKPIIAAVNGPAVGAGAALVLASDIVVACNAATFGFPEPRRGIVSGLAAPLLQFRIGGGRTSYLLLTADMIDAALAAEWGVYHEIVETSMLWVRGTEIAASIASTAQEAIQLTKKNLNEMVGEHLSAQLASGAAASATSRTTEAAEEGVRAFLEKRPPLWP